MLATASLQHDCRAEKRKSLPSESSLQMELLTDGKDWYEDAPAQRSHQKTL